MPIPSVVKDKCNGCGDCVVVCPFFALELVDNVVTIAESCLDCGVCVSACAAGALVYEGVEGIQKGGGVWYLAPGGDIEAAGTARYLADEWGRSAAAVIFDQDALPESGPDQVLVIPGGDARVLAAAIRDEKPGAVLAPDRDYTRDLLAQTAALLKVSFFSGVTSLQPVYGKDSVEVVRPIFLGRYHVRVQAQSSPVLATLQKGALLPARAMALTSVPRLLDVEPAAGPEVMRQESGLGYVPVLEEADIILSGGPSIGQEGFELLNALARRMGAVVAGSKEAVQAGLLPPERMVDAFTGKKIAPSLYIAFGIDGSPGHNAAITLARTVVAVNDRADTNLAAAADFILTADIRAIMEAMLSE
ncbi:MAG: FAD-binding protein [Bacillota bacterium]